MNAEEIYRSRLRGSTNNPNLRTGLPSNESNSGWNWSNIWQNRWPWEEPATEPEESLLSTVGRWTGTAFAAPFITSKMEPEEKERYKAEKDDNWWKAHFGEESQFASEYRDLPVWGQMLAEAPAALLTGGLASGGIKALGSAVAKGGLKSGLARVGQGALSTLGGDATAVFKGAQKAGGLAGKVAQGLAAPGMAAEKAIGGVTNLISKGIARSLKPSQLQILKKLASKPEIPDETKITIAKVTGLIKEAKPTLTSQAEERSQELGKRVGKVFQAQENLQGSAAFKATKKYLSGELPTGKPTQGYTEIASQVTKEEFEQMMDLPLRATFKAPKEHQALLKLRTQNAVQKLFNPQVYGMPQRNEIQLLQNVFGEDLAKSILDKRSLGQKAFETIVEVANLPRALLASGDISYLLRQGMVLAASNPKEAGKTIIPAIRSFFSDSVAQNIDNMIRADDIVGPAIAKGHLKLPELPGGVASALSEREEAFISSMAEKIPIAGSLIKGSNRAYTSGLNMLRANVYKKTVQSYAKMGLELTDVDLSELGSFIMAATGRMDLGKFEGASQLLSTIFFSPKLIISRAALPKYLMSPSRVVRQEAAKSIASFLAAGSSLLTLAHLRGWADIETDPRSSDFAKIKMGDTRLDVWAGYQQYTRLLASLFTGERKTQAGAVIEANRYDTGLRFLESKLSPVMGLIRDLLKDETYLGEDMSAEGGFVLEQAYQRMAPLAAQDIIDAIVQEGISAGIPASLAFWGVGVATYPAPSEEQLFNAKRTMAYANIEDVVWSKNPEGLDIAKKYNEMKKEDAMKAKRYLAQYPQVIRALKEIENLKERWLIQNKRRT